MASTDYEQPPAKLPPQRAAIVFLGEETLRRLLQLPWGWQVMGAQIDFYRNGIAIKVTGPDAPECPEGMVPWEVAAPHLIYEGPTAEELEIHPRAAGRIVVPLPDWQNDHP